MGSVTRVNMSEQSRLQFLLVIKATALKEQLERAARSWL